MRHVFYVLLVLALTANAEEDTSGNNAEEIVLDDIYAQASGKMSPQQQVAFRRYWAGLYDESKWPWRIDLVSEYLDAESLAELKSGLMPMTENGIVTLHWEHGSHIHYVAVFDTNSLNVPAIPIYSTNSRTVFELVQLKVVAPGIYLGRYEPGQLSYVGSGFGAFYIDGDIGEEEPTRRRRIKESWKGVSRYE